MEAALLAVVIYLGGFWSGHQYEKMNQLETEQVITQVRQAADESAAAAIAKIEVQHQTVYQPVMETIRSEVKYRECKHDAKTLLLINEAITGVKQGGAP